MAGERTLAAGIGLTTDWDEGSDGWKAGVDLNWLTLNYVGTALMVQSRTDALPTGTVPDAVIYIATSGEATGIDEFDIAIRDEDAWVIVNPIHGLHAYVIDEDAWYLYDATLAAPKWVPSGFNGSLVATVSAGTFAPADVNMSTYNRLTHGTACVVTLPDGIPAGREIHFEAAGAGAYTFVGESTGSVLNYPATKLPQIGEQYTVVTAKSLGGDEWNLIGALADAT